MQFQTIEFGLTIRPSTGPAAPAAAWFIAGSGPADWVSELSSWGVPLDEVRLFPLPESARTRRACGVLVVVGGKPRVVRAMPYAVLADRLFYPADAVVWPPVSVDELTAALRHDVMVLHPSAGLVGFAAADARRVSDLLAVPPRGVADWSHAEAPPKPLPRLISVEAEPVPMDLSVMFQEGRDDIGSEADEDLFSDQDEPEKSGPASGGIGQKIAGLFMSMFEGGGKNPKQKAQNPNSLQSRRERELERLLKMLKDNPDLGLQHALPMAGLPTRGMAPPGNTLGRRDVDFNLSRLSGGNRRSDPWVVAEQMRQKLIAQYREAANRELNLGRHRRAAYIFAELLGDYSSAAGALRQGRHFREAAAVYREQLKNPRAAADCLVAGGLISEAIPLYWDLHEFDIAGDLYARLGETATAAECYRQAVARAIEANDPLAAAKLLEVKLDAVDESLEVLAGAWPDSDKAGVCLSAWFELTGRLGRHESATARARELRESPGRSLLPIEILATVAAKYPNAQVRHRSADTARVLVGRHLSKADPAGQRSMVKMLTGLVPGDKLLARDGARYLDRPKPRRSAPIPMRGDPQIVRKFSLPDGRVRQWRLVVPVPSSCLPVGGFIALGTDESRCVLVRGAWDGSTQAVGAIRDTTADESYAMFEPDLNRRIVLAAFSAKGRNLIGTVTLPAMIPMGGELIASTPACINYNSLSACRDEYGTLWTFGTETELECHSSDGILLSTHAVEWPGLNTRGKQPLMAARRGHVYLAAGTTLHRWTGGRSAARTDLPGVVRTLVPSPSHTAVRMLLTFEQGAALVRDGGCRRFADRLVNPVGTFTPDGSIVVIGRRQGHVYKSAGDADPSFVAAFDLPVESPVAVLPAEAGKVGILDADGVMYVCGYTAG